MSSTPPLHHMSATGWVEVLSVPEIRRDWVWVWVCGLLSESALPRVPQREEGGASRNGEVPSECCREFWLVSNRFLARLYTSPLVTVAAIRGECRQNVHRKIVHSTRLACLPFRCRASLYCTEAVTLTLLRLPAGACPAGGCCLSMCCDYRVMTESGSIGKQGRAGEVWVVPAVAISGVAPAVQLCTDTDMGAQHRKRAAKVSIACPSAVLKQTAAEMMLRASVPCRSE
jgi:hypothetical protein